jgi:hypothetical protein
VISTCEGDFMNPADWKARMCITKEGNVGIGTTEPGAKLTVGRGDIWLDGTSARRNSLLYFRWTATKGTIQSDNDIAFRVGDDPWFDAVTIKKSGNVGIGTTEPEARLEVNGDARITGGLKPDYDSGWFTDNATSNHVTTLTHNLGVYPTRFQIWFSPVANPSGTDYIYPVYKFHQENSVWSQPEVRFTTTTMELYWYGPGYMFRWYNSTLLAWSSWDSGYIRVLLWK